MLFYFYDLKMIFKYVASHNIIIIIIITESDTMQEVSQSRKLNPSNILHL